MDYRHHPIIEGLKINEDGSSIIYLGKELEPRKINKSGKKKTDTILVSFNNSVCSVARLVCEAWHGMAENIDFNATRVKNENGFHYTNLYWAKKGVNPNYHDIKFPRAKSSKIPESDIPKIVKRLNQGEALNSIALDYNTSDMSISRIKKRYVKKDK
jgi:hypothetical protein